MGLPWIAAGILKAKQGFRYLTAQKHLPVLKDARQNHRTGQSAAQAVDRLANAAKILTKNATLGVFNRVRGIPLNGSEVISSIITSLDNEYLPSLPASV